MVTSVDEDNFCLRVLRLTYCFWIFDIKRNKTNLVWQSIHIRSNFIAVHLYVNAKLYTQVSVHYYTLTEYSITIFFITHFQHEKKTPLLSHELPVIHLHISRECNPFDLKTWRQHMSNCVRIFGQCVFVLCVYLELTSNGLCRGVSCFRLSNPLADQWKEKHRPCKSLGLCFKAELSVGWVRAH